MHILTYKYVITFNKNDLLFLEFSNLLILFNSIS